MRIARDVVLVLAALASTALLGVTLHFTYETYRSVHAALAPATYKGLRHFTYTCQTNALEASCVLTNSEVESSTACWQASVKRKGTSKSVDALVVCTGLVHPAETVHSTAPYAIDAVQELCRDNGGTGSMWDNCQMDVEDRTR